MRISDPDLRNGTNPDLKHRRALTGKLIIVIHATAAAPFLAPLSAVLHIPIPALSLAVLLYILASARSFIFK